MSSPRARAFVGLILTILAAAVLTVAAAMSYRGKPPAPIASAPLHCPDVPVDLSGQHIVAGTQIPGDLSCANLRNTVFDGIDLVQADLVGVDARGASFRRTDLTQADLSEANLQGAHFDDAKLGQAELIGANAESAWFIGADLSQVEATGIRLRGADLNSADLTQATLTGADMRDADLTFASATQATMTGADLRGASLWLTDSIQADTGSVGIAAVEAGVVQLPYVVGLAFLILMALRVVRLFRLPPDLAPIPGALRRLRVTLPVGAAVFAVACLFGNLVVGQILSVWTVDPLLDSVAAGAVFVLGMVVNSLLTREPGSRISPVRVRTG